MARLGNLCLSHQIGMAVEGFDIDGGLTEADKARMARALDELTERCRRAFQAPTLVKPMVSRGGTF